LRRRRWRSRRRSTSSRSCMRTRCRDVMGLQRATATSQWAMLLPPALLPHPPPPSRHHHLSLLPPRIPRKVRYFFLLPLVLINPMSLTASRAAIASSPDLDDDPVQPKPPRQFVFFFHPSYRPSLLTPPLPLPAVTIRRSESESTSSTPTLPTRKPTFNLSSKSFANPTTTLLPLNPPLLHPSLHLHLPYLLHNLHYLWSTLLLGSSDDCKTSDSQRCASFLSFCPPLLTHTLRHSTPSRSNPLHPAAPPPSTSPRILSSLPNPLSLFPLPLPSVKQTLLATSPLQNRANRSPTARFRTGLMRICDRLVRTIWRFWLRRCVSFPLLSSPLYAVY
jgi:hypothetical protein